ncbi:MAG: hypothetical protein LLF96_12620 [Eubacteriales bacterium]|nr:hypothetical protein [Eubacteriales bacterium]
MKRFSFVLAVVMLLSMLSIPALAEEATEPNWDSYATYKILVEAEGDQVRLTGDTKNIIEADNLKFKDLNGNGSLDIYEDWRQDVDARVENLLSQMTLEEKVGLLFFSGLAGQNGSTTQNLLNNETIWTGEEYLPTVDGTVYANVTMQINDFKLNTLIFAESGTPYEQLLVANRTQAIAEDSRLGIPVTFNGDRSYNTWGGMVDMPHYALGTAHDEALLYNICLQYAKELNALGQTGTFHTYGLEIGSWYGDEVNYIAQMTAAETKAYEDGGINSTSKHFIARGGRSSFSNALSDGDLWESYMVGWKAAVDAGTTYVMLNNGSGLTDGVMTYFDSTTINYLRETLGYDGIIVTDWPLFMGGPSGSGITVEGEDLSTFTPEQIYAKILTVGVDQFGVGTIVHGTDVPSLLTEYSYASAYGMIDFPDLVVAAVNDGSLSMDIVDRSASRVLKNKFNLGLFEDAFRDWDAAKAVFASDAYDTDEFAVASNDDIESARNDTMNSLDEQVQTESAILFKNDNNLLPLAQGTKVFYASNNATTQSKDQEALAAYCELVEKAADADVIVIHATSKDDSYELLLEDALSAGKPIVLVLEGTINVEPGTYETESYDAILMQVYLTTPDHGLSTGNFYHYTKPSITADMLFGVKEPGGSTVFEIARNETDAALDWSDLQVDTGVSDEVRLYMAALVKEDPTYELPNNLGDVLYTTDFGMQYGKEAAFTFDTLVLPKTVVTEEVASFGGSQSQNVAKETVVAGEPFTIRFIAWNNGADGTFNAEVYDGDEQIASKFYALDSNQFRIVSLELTLDAGEHTISVCGLTKTINVSE